MLSDSKHLLQTLTQYRPIDNYFQTGEILRVLHQLEEKQISFQWIFFHCGIPRSEMADRMAGIASRLGSRPDIIQFLQSSIYTVVCPSGLEEGNNRTLEVTFLVSPNDHI